MGGNHLTFLKNYGETTDIFQHPRYDPTTLAFDLTLVKLRQPVDDVPYIRMIPKSANNMALIGKSVVTSGWGKTEDGQFPDFLHKTTLTIIKNEDCRGSSGNIQPMDEKTICATSPQLSGICSGDSGGPLTVMYEGERVLLGVTSWSINEDCSYVSLSGFINVLYFKDWIKKSTKIPLK